MKEKGTYFGKLQSGIVGQAKTGSPQMCIEFTVTHILGADGQWQGCDEFVRTVFMPMTDNAWPYAVEKLERLGFDGNFKTPGFSDAAQAEGVELLCRHESYEGRSVEKWDLAGGGSYVPKPAGDDAVRRLAEKWKMRAKPAGGPPPKTPPTAPATNDGLPY